MLTNGTTITKRVQSNRANNKSKNHFSINKETTKSRSRTVAEPNNEGVTKWDANNIQSRPRMPTPRSSIVKKLSMERRESKTGSPIKSKSNNNKDQNTLSSAPPPALTFHDHTNNNQHRPGSISNMTPNIQSKLKAIAHDECEKTIPLGAVLHILRARRMDQLNLQCFVYLVFLLLYTAVANLHHNILDSYSQNFGMREMLLNEPFNEPDDLRTYMDVGEIDEWWLWFEGPFANKIWVDEWYNNEKREVLDGGVLLAEAYVVGSVRVRQVRTKEYEKINYGRKFKAWYPYSTDNEMTTNDVKYGTYIESGLSELNGHPYDTFATLNYGFGGYAVEFSRANITSSLEMVKHLKQIRWLDGGTRIVAVDLNVYNPSTDVITALRVQTEFLNSGLILKQGWAFSGQVTKYSTELNDVVRGVMELIVLFFVFYYWYQQILEICQAGGLCSYRFTLFDVLSQINLLLIVVAIAIHLWFNYTFSDFNGGISFESNIYIDLYTPLELWAVKKNLVGLTLLFGYFRLFRYLELNARIKVLIYAMMNSMEDLITTFFVLCTCIGAFAVCGMLLFGENLQEFSAISHSISTLLRATIGDFDCYIELRYFHPMLAPAYYAAYVFVVLLVVFNMLIAVIIDGYEEAKNIILHQKVDQDRAPFVQSRLMYFIKKISGKLHHLFLVGCSKDPVALVRRKSVAPQRQKQHDDKGEQGEQGEHEAGYTTTRPAGVKENESEEEGEPRRSNMNNSEVLQRLAKNQKNTTTKIKLLDLVEHVKKSNDTLKPAQELKELFHGDIESKFRKMYARDTLSTHAIGDEALVRLNVYDLKGILGSKKIGQKVLQLYTILKNREKEHNEFIRQNKHGLRPTMHPSMDITSMDEMDQMHTMHSHLTHEISQSSHSNDTASISNSQINSQINHNMQNQMAQAINSLSQHISLIADAVVINKKARDLIQPIHIKVSSQNHANDMQQQQQQRNSDRDRDIMLWGKSPAMMLKKKQIPKIHRIKSRDQLVEEVRLSREMLRNKVPMRSSPARNQGKRNTTFA